MQTDFSLSDFRPEQFKLQTARWNPETVTLHWNPFSLLELPVSTALQTP